MGTKANLSGKLTDVLVYQRVERKKWEDSSRSLVLTIGVMILGLTIFYFKYGQREWGPLEILLPLFFLFVSSTVCVKLNTQRKEHKNNTEATEREIERRQVVVSLLAEYAIIFSGASREDIQGVISSLFDKLFVCECKDGLPVRGVFFDQYGAMPDWYLDGYRTKYDAILAEYRLPTPEDSVPDDALLPLYIQRSEWIKVMQNTPTGRCLRLGQQGVVSCYEDKDGQNAHLRGVPLMTPAELNSGKGVVGAV